MTPLKTILSGLVLIFASALAMLVVNTMTVDILCLTLIAAGAAMVWVSAKKGYDQPLLRMAEAARAMADGKADMAVAEDCSGPAGQLAGSLAAMGANNTRTTEALRAEVQALTDRLDKSESDLERALEKEKRIEALLSSLKGTAQRAETIYSRVASSVDELSREVDNVTRGVQVQHDRMTETATAMEEMTSTVGAVAENAASAAENAVASREKARTGAQGVRSAVSSIETIERRIVGLKETMNNLGLKAQSSGRVLNVITDIADQTNLLALNAAIEAARAGEAGRGFAVVADEVRKLAEKTMTATKEVEAAIKDMQDEARDNVRAVEQTAEDIVQSTQLATESGRFMDEIVEIVGNTSTQVESIATASEQQTTVSEEINDAVSDVTRVASETSEGMNRSAGQLAAITGLLGELDAIIRDMASLDIGSDFAGTATPPPAGDKRDLVTWNDSLITGINSIDAQHKKLVALINELNRAMQDQMSDAFLLEVLDRLSAYVTEHFTREETLFDRHGYPASQKHKDLHAAFVSKVSEFHQEMREGKYTVSMDVMRFLKQWLVKHIQGEDMQYVPFFKEHGVS